MSSASPDEIIRYLRECYRENGSRSGLWNFYGSTVHNRVFIKDEPDPILKDPTGIDSHFLRGAAAETLAKQTHLYQKERDCWYATIFVVGWVERYEGKPEAICAPLFLYPATIQTDEVSNGAVLQIDSANGQLNAAVIEAIGGEDFFKTIEAETEKGPLSEGCVGTIRRTFLENFADSETSSLLSYPELVSGRALRKAFSEVEDDSESPLRLIPAAAVSLVNKSNEMRGVLNELEAMAESGATLAPPIRALLAGEDTKFSSTQPGRIPAHLSAAQQKVVDSSLIHPLTMAIGPPGTGKSFTIAALAIEALSRGKSVIIASKMDHAVDVAGDKIESTIGLDGAVVRGGRKGYLKKLKKFIEELLSGIHTSNCPTTVQIREVEKQLDYRQRVIGNQNEWLMDRFEDEKKWGTLLARKQPGWFTKWRQRRIGKKLDSIQSVKEMADELAKDTEKETSETLNFLRMKRKQLLFNALDIHRDSFQRYNRGIRSRTGTRQEEFFEWTNWNILLGALPVWLVNMSDVYKILPDTAELFDLAIIDEASQCDIASALPILQRAKRAVIAGDPKQLRHLSFLPKRRQRELGEAHCLDDDQLAQFNFRDVSLLDLVSEQIGDQSRIAFLNEHFRSRPEIIEFSNREFYAGQLQVMTGNHQSSHRNDVAESPLRVTRVNDGIRSTSGINEIEAKKILQLVLERCENQAKSRPAAPPMSVGILSPFRKQVDFLRKKLAELPQGNSLLTRNKLLIGTAHTFQGEERDEMFISLTLDDESPAASFRFLEKTDLFNVAITRARNLNHIFHSFSPEKPGFDSLISKYLAFAASVEQNVKDGLNSKTATAAKNTHDKFASEVAEFLEANGAEVTVGYQLAGTTIDLLVSNDGKSHGIDLIGYPGAFTNAFPVERILTFQRANLKIVPLTFSAWHFQREKCEEWLRNQIGS